MYPTLLLAATLASLSLSAPTPALFSGFSDFEHDLHEFYSKVGGFIDSVTHAIEPYTFCDKSKIAIPSSSDLPSPDGQHPLYVALGRGTQNYTCETSTADSTPQAIGALANLYDVTCMAANYPNFLSTATDMAYNIRLPNNLMSTLPPANMKLLGHHYFQGSIPVFNLNTPNEQHGIAFTKLDDKMKAPVNAVEGNHGAVAWLYLTTVQGTVGDFSSVYRVNTASGAPPATCENMPDHFEVQYAANYYFYGK